MDRKRSSSTATGESAALQHVIGHGRDCPACNAFRRSVLSIALDELPFEQAWDVWYPEKEQTIGPKTRTCYLEYKKALSRFFSGMRLKDIHIGNILAYRRDRLAGWRSPITNKDIPGAGPNLINHEIDALRQLMKRGGCWAPIEDHYKQLKVHQSTIGQRPMDEEIVHLFQCAQKNPRWRVAYLASMVMIQTAAGPEEVLGIKLGHIDWNGQSVHIHGTKTDVRPRDIPMTEDCYFALHELELIARHKGASSPEHFLFPHRGNKLRPGSDPTRHQNEIRGAWRGLCKLAAKKYPRLLHLRRKDLRHFSLSAMCENPAMDELTIKRIAGQGPGSRMLLEVYFHTRQKRRQEAVSVLQGITKPKVAAPVKKQSTPPDIPLMPPSTAKRPAQPVDFAVLPPKEYIN